MSVQKAVHSNLVSVASVVSSNRHNELQKITITLFKCAGSPQRSFFKNSRFDFITCRLLLKFTLQTGDGLRTLQLNCMFTCETFNVIYLIQCRLCNLQYIGETKRRLKDRFNEHRRPLLNPTGNYTHTAVSEQFLTSNHSDNDMLLIPTEKLKNGRDSFRKPREAHLIHKAKTIEPLGINKRDEL